MFPLLLAAFGWIGIDPLEAGRYINATAFGLTILAAGLYLRSNLQSQSLTLAATATLLTSLPLSNWAAHFLTDPLFILLTLLALLQLATFLNRKTTAPLLLSAIFTALAAITRYPGIVLIAAGVLILLPLARLKHTILFGTISSIPLLIVLIRNWAATETLTGSRSGTRQSLADGLSRVADVFRTWVIPPNAPTELAPLLWLTVAAVGLTSAAIILRSTRTRSNNRLKLVLPFGVFALTYLVFIVAIVPLVVPMEFPKRYLLPIYVPLLLTAALLLDQFLSIKAAGRSVAAKWCLTSLVILSTLTHIGFSTQENLRITRQAWRDGFITWASNGSYWESSELRNYTQTNFSNDDSIYSNVSTLVWFWNRTAAPGKYQSLPYEIHSLTSSLLEWSDGDSPYILWLRHKELSCDYDDLDLRLLPGVKTVAELSDGVVFRVTAAEPFDAQKHRAQKERYVNELIEQASEHVIRADWTVYRTKRTLIYFKKPCAPADTQAKFVLHVTPANPKDLSISRKRHDSDNLDFYFDQHGKRFDDQCIALAHLPDYAISRIYIGQWIAAENRTLWEAEFAGASE